jgi:hypothetical protein
MSNETEESNEIKVKSKRGGARPGAGRHRRLPQEPMTTERQIELLESKLPQASPVAAAALAKRISVLSGLEPKPYAGHPQAAKFEPKPEPPMELPSWWAANHWRILVSEHASGRPWPGQWGNTLEEMEREWAESEGKTVAELREQLSRETAEFRSRHSDVERGEVGPAGRDARVEIRNVDGRILIVENDQVRAEIVAVPGPVGKDGPRGERGETGTTGMTGAAGHTPTEDEVAAVVRKLFGQIAKAA